ncbi:MAG: NCS2 family permease, partial [Rhodospirillaceae bacterium]|nr:NCS2 family permease [Rhodospirillaceae bacterium]
MLDNLFKLSDHGTTVRIEVMAGLTTFLTMAYIIIVNPDIMSAAGMDKGALFVATCVAAAVGCLIMGLWANYPIALAPGLGLNAFFAFGVVGGMGVPWQTALGVIFLSGVFFLIITILPIRAAIINSIPKSLKMSISAGIGLFIGVIAMEISGITVDHPVTLVTLGEVASPQVILVAIGFIGIIALDRLAVPGAIVLGIIGTTILAHIFGLGGSTALDFSIPSLAPTFLQLDIAGAFQISMISVIIAFLFVDMFDTAGTLIGVSHRAGLLDEDGKLPRMGKALSADSIATITGSLVG